MSASCLRHTVLPGTTRLFSDFVYHFDRVARFYRHDPWQTESFRRAAREVDYPAARRTALVAALREYNGASESLELLAQPGTVAVVTGQQVGLFSGPCYTIYKALTAIRHATRLREQGVTAVPVFWLATEDHDFEEVGHAWNFNAAHQPMRQQVSNPGAGNRPVGGIAVPDFPVDDLRRCLSGFAFGDEVSALVAGTYRGGRTLGTAFVDLMRRLLPDSGLLYVDPMQPAIRAIAAPLMRHAVDSAKSFIDLVLERNAELEAAGYHAQVHVELKTSPFFLLKDGQRLATLPGNGGFAHLAAQAEHLSPNALLRPVVQDYLLPTAVLVGGPAELAYLAQTGVIYHALDRPMPVVLPRAGLTLLDARAEKLLGRYHLSIPDFFDGSEPVRQRIAAQLVPTGLQQTLRNSHAAAEKLLDGLQHEVARFDPTLGAALNRSRAKILHQLTRIEAKTAREALRRDARAQAEAAYLSGLLFPEKHLQERLYTILPFLARHGLGLLDTLRESVSLECPDHVVLTL